MLNASLPGKITIGEIEDDGLVELFSGSEDALTSTVFKGLSYLPDRVLCEILFAEEIWRERVTIPRSIISIKYWPRWRSFMKDGHKIPDCVIAFEDRVLIIEAKRFDFTYRQSSRQLADEWLAGRVVYGDVADKALWLLAVSGLPDSRSETVAEIREAVRREIRSAAGGVAAGALRFAATPWFGLFKVIEGRCVESAGLGPQVQRLLEDIRAGMLLHGVSVEPPTWLADLTGRAWKPNRPVSAGSLSVFAGAPSRT